MPKKDAKPKKYGYNLISGSESLRFEPRWDIYEALTHLRAYKREHPDQAVVGYFDEEKIPVGFEVFIDDRCKIYEPETELLAALPALRNYKAGNPNNKVEGYFNDISIPSGFELVVGEECIRYEPDWSIEKSLTSLRNYKTGYPDQQNVQGYFNDVAIPVAYELFMDGECVSYAPDWEIKRALTDLRAQKKNNPEKKVVGYFNNNVIPVGFELFVNNTCIQYGPDWEIKRALTVLRSHGNEHPDKIVEGFFNDSSIPGGYELFIDGECVSYHPEWTDLQAVSDLRSARASNKKNKVDGFFNNRPIPQGYELYENEICIRYEEEWPIEQALTHLRKFSTEKSDSEIKGFYNNQPIPVGFELLFDDRVVDYQPDWTINQAITELQGSGGRGYFDNREISTGYALFIDGECVLYRSSWSYKTALADLRKAKINPSNANKKVEGFYKGNPIPKGYTLFKGGSCSDYQTEWTVEQALTDLYKRKKDEPETAWEAFYDDVPIPRGFELYIGGECINYQPNWTIKQGLTQRHKVLGAECFYNGKPIPVGYSRFEDGICVVYTPELNKVDSHTKFHFTHFSTRGQPIHTDKKHEGYFGSVKLGVGYEQFSHGNYVTVDPTLTILEALIHLRNTNINSAANARGFYDDIPIPLGYELYKNGQCIRYEPQISASEAQEDLYQSKRNTPENDWVGYYNNKAIPFSGYQLREKNKCIRYEPKYSELEARTDLRSYIRSVEGSENGIQGFYNGREINLSTGYELYVNDICVKYTTGWKESQAETDFLNSEKSDSYRGKRVYGYFDGELISPMIVLANQRGDEKTSDELRKLERRARQRAQNTSVKYPNMPNLAGVQGVLFDEILAIAEKYDWELSENEKLIKVWLEHKIIQNRKIMADVVKEEFNKWIADPENYTAPAGTPPYIKRIDVSDSIWTSPVGIFISVLYGKPAYLPPNFAVMGYLATYKKLMFENAAIENMQNIATATGLFETISDTAFRAVDIMGELENFKTLQKMAGAIKSIPFLDVAVGVAIDVISEIAAFNTSKSKTNWLPMEIENAEINLELLVRSQHGFNEAFLCFQSTLLPSLATNIPAQDLQLESQELIGVHKITLTDIGLGMRELDWIELTTTPYTDDPSKICITLMLQPNLWWKGIELRDRNSQMHGILAVFGQKETLIELDGGSSMLQKSCLIDRTKLYNQDLILSKGKLLGVHTEVYQIADAFETMQNGIEYIFNWKTDNTPDKIPDLYQVFIKDLDGRTTLQDGDLLKIIEKPLQAIPPAGTPPEQTQPSQGLDGSTSDVIEKFTGAPDKGFGPTKTVGD